MSELLLRGVSKAFGRTPVLSGLDLSVESGTVLAVLGRSGSGKTTLLRLVAGTERVDAGEVLLGGEVVDNGRRFVSPERRRVGYVAQEGALFPHLSVARNVGFGLERAARRQGRVEELLEMVNLLELKDRYPHELSGGQAQRVALARALAPRPRLVLLDEPFSALDATLRASLRGEVVQILRRTAVTTLLVTHDQEEALSVADLVGVMAGGRIRQLARPEELYARPADPAVAAFLGEANLVAGEAAGRLARTTLGELALSGDCPVRAGAVTVLVRPEQLRLSMAGGPGRPGRVVHREYYGHDSIYLVALETTGERVRVREGGPARFEIGAEVAVRAEGEMIAWSKRATLGL